jgi:hypothetical protein
MWTLVALPESRLRAKCGVEALHERRILPLGAHKGLAALRRPRHPRLMLNPEAAPWVGPVNVSLSGFRLHSLHAPTPLRHGLVDSSR